jgi:cytochrome P450
MHFAHSLRGAQEALINTVLLKRDLFHFLDSVGGQAGAMGHIALADGGFWLINEPDLIRQVLTAAEGAIGKPDFLLRSIRGEHGDGLSSLGGEQWAVRRALLGRAFTPALLAHVAVATRKATVAALAQWPQDGPIDLAELLSRLITRAGAHWILSADVGGQTAEGTIPWAEADGVRYQVEVQGVAHDLMPAQRLRAGAVPVLRKIILAKWRAHNDGPDFIGVLRACCRAGATMLSEDEVVDEIVQLLFAAHHTVTTTLVHCIDFLHLHPGLAARVAMCARLNGGADAAPMAERKYTEYFIKEVMRFCMPTTLLFREAKQAQILAGHALRAGDLLVISPYLLHRNCEHFPDPLQFEPLRFGSPVNPYAYLPFGAGPRRCVAHRLALLQMQVILETLILMARFEPLGEAPRNRFAVTYPGHPYLVRYARLPG